MSGARLVWAAPEATHTDVVEDLATVMSMFDSAICDGRGWPRLTRASGGPIQVNPAWVEGVIPVPPEEAF